MKRLAEVLEQCDARTDTKARRRTNTAPRTVANITAAEIERGVTLERLESLNVPVYQYGTQVTIHGRLPEIDANARQAGYKATVRNANGSIGVRYVAIDAEKKQLLYDATRYAAARPWSVSLCSTGMMVTRWFEKRDECAAAYAAFPRDSFAGNIRAGVCEIGGYLIVATIGAIPAATFWTLAEHLTGFASEAAFRAAKAEQDARDDAERAGYDAAREARENAGREAMAALLARLEFPEAARLDTVPALKPGARFVTVFADWRGEAQARLVVVTRLAFGRAMYAATAYRPDVRDWNPQRGQDKERSVDDARLRAWRSIATDGGLFAI